VTYEEFKRLWGQALRESGLRADDEGQEELDLHRMTRTHRHIVEWSGDDAEEGFRIGAKLTWSWSALQTARTAIEEVEMLGELLGPHSEIQAEAPWLRVEVTLHAIAVSQDGMPMPAAPAWGKWASETLARLERVEPLVPPPVIRESKTGRLRLLSMQEPPVVTATCQPNGELRLERIAMTGWQGLDLPRETYDEDPKPRERLYRQLVAMFARVKAALHAWMEVLDHFT
jgi:hypothetical protein